MFCTHCGNPKIIKKGFYRVKHSRSYLRRYQCLSCKRTFSSQTHAPTYYQKKPYLNLKLFELLTSGNTQRRSAKLLGCARSTVERKFHWLYRFRNSLEFNQPKQVFSPHLQFDEMESIHHTKLKPLTIPLCVDENYKILALGVGSIPAKGHLANLSRKKYGPRADMRELTINKALSNVKKFCPEPLTITTDEAPIYKKLIKTHFPKSQHITVSSRAKKEKHREMVYTSKQKKIFDPMFQLNQRCAKLRQDIRRLARRSWCTTKKVENLRKHLELYQIYNNNLQII